jgi:hypothetical protein
MQLCRDCHNEDLEPEFKHRLEAAPSCGRTLSNGRQVYETFVEPAKVDLNRVGAHLALCSVFEHQNEESTKLYCYKTHVENYRRIEAGAQVLITGGATIESEITWQQHAIEMTVLYLGDHHLFCSVRPQTVPQDFSRVCEQLQRAFRRGDTSETMRLMNNAFGGPSYSLTHLFKDQQRHILHRLLEQTREETARSYRRIYEHNYAIMKMVRNLNMPLPMDLAAPTAFVLNQDILRHLHTDPIDWQRLRICSTHFSSIGLAPGPDSPPTITQWMPVSGTRGIGPSKGSSDRNRVFAGIRRSVLTRST